MPRPPVRPRPKPQSPVRDTSVAASMRRGVDGCAADAAPQHGADTANACGGGDVRRGHAGCRGSAALLAYFAQEGGCLEPRHSSAASVGAAVERG